MDAWTAKHRQLLEYTDDLNLSLVELVVAVSECSEDESEIQDMVDGCIDSGRILVSRAA